LVLHGIDGRPLFRNNAGDRSLCWSRRLRCGGLAFLERPFMGKLSALIVFFNVDGGIMFKVFVGRDEKRELKADQLAKFRALGDRLCGS
jgi:heme iron utilization protein